LQLTKDISTAMKHCADYARCTTYMHNMTTANSHSQKVMPASDVLTEMQKIHVTPLSSYSMIHLLTATGLMTQVKLIC